MTAKNKILGVILALVAGAVVGYLVHGSAQKSLGAGDLVDLVPTIYVNGVSTGDGFTTYKKLSLPTAVNQASWLNNTGKTIFVDEAVALPTGTASTSLSLIVGTSSAATVTDSATPITGRLIDAYLIATSTNPLAINSLKDGGSNGREVIQVRSGEYVIFLLENPYNQACTGSVCETATSTNRGFNINAFFHYTYSL